VPETAAGCNFAAELRHKVTGLGVGLVVSKALAVRAQKAKNSFRTGCVFDRGIKVSCRVASSFTPYYLLCFLHGSSSGSLQCQNSVRNRGLLGRNVRRTLEGRGLLNLTTEARRGKYGVQLLVSSRQTRSSTAAAFSCSAV
jgi:hypothetical protein